MLNNFSKTLNSSLEEIKKKANESLEDVRKAVEKQTLGGRNDDHQPPQQQAQQQAQQHAPTTYSGEYNAQNQPNNAPSRNAGLVGPFIKFAGTITGHQGMVNRYTIMVVTPPGKEYPPQLRISAGGALGQPIQLDQFAGHKFWRFDVHVPVTHSEQRVCYSVNGEREYAFFIPGRDQAYKWAFFSCNGFSTDVDMPTRQQLNGIKPLWTDVMRDHAQRPYHAMVGGGDQLYCDTVFDIPSLKEWLANPSKEYKKTALWSQRMNEEAHRYYFDEYLSHFQQPGFNEALASIPFNFTWDDHDIFDGYGSYPDYLQNCDLFNGIFIAAQRFYLLFQHHTNLGLARRDGYIGTKGHSSIVQYGPYMAVLMVDVRTERSLTQIVSEGSWGQIWRALEQLPRTTRHLIAAMTIPVAYPRLEGEAMVSVAAVAMTGFTSAISAIGSAVTGNKNHAWVDAFQKTGPYKSVLNSLGEPELLDDLNDHWTSKNHEHERSTFIRNLQQVAYNQNLRVTFLSGDVHCCGAGKLYSSDNAPADRDHRLMYQLVSSAIGNIPPPPPVIRMLHMSTKELSLGADTRENMHPIFERNLDDQPHDHKFLMGRRNWCRVTSPQHTPSGLLFEINVERNPGDLSGNTKSYGLEVPALRLR